MAVIVAVGEEEARMAVSGEPITDAEGSGLIGLSLDGKEGPGGNVLVVQGNVRKLEGNFQLWYLALSVSA